MEVKLEAVLIGRTLAGVVVVLAVVSAIVGAPGARSGGFDLFLWRLATPLGVGFLIIVATEILRAMERPRTDGMRKLAAGSSRTLSFYGGAA